MTEITLIVADWCPICPGARKLWAGMARRFYFDYREVDIASQEGSTLAKKHSILAVPATLFNDKVVFRGVPEFEEAKRQLINHHAKEK